MTAFEPAEGHVRVRLDAEWVETHSLIIASGASARWLGLPGEKALIGHGVTSCATCDGAFYRNVPVCVVGGGDSACEEATFLTRFASEVFPHPSPRGASGIENHGRTRPRQSEDQADLEQRPHRLSHRRAGEVCGINLRDTVTGEERVLPVKCVFVAIGHTPNTVPFREHLETDENGYLLQRTGTHTNLPGVFAAGDVADHVYRQAITAAGQGCAAALDAERFLTSVGD